MFQLSARSLALIALLAVALTFVWSRSSSAGTAPIVVTVDTTSADEGGGGPTLTTCGPAAGDCSLRGAIVRVNANLAVGGRNTINFGILSGVQTISLTRPLPAITGPALVDGTTQKLAPFGNANCLSFFQVPCILINGGGVTLGEGLILQGGSSEVRGLAIYGFRTGILLDSSGNIVKQSFLGTPDGLTGGSGNSGGGVTVNSGEDNQIGVPGGLRNVISGNGVGVSDSGTRTLIRGNLIGTDMTGNAPLPNTNGGLVVGGDDAVVGGAGPEGNVVSGNDDVGVAIATGSDRGQVLGNIIGLGADGVTAIPNGGSGILFSVAHDVTIGGSGEDDRNVISGNDEFGIKLDGDVGVIENVQILGNYIGTDVSGTLARGNGAGGVGIVGASNNVVGAPGMGSLISGNDAVGSRAIFIRPGLTAANNNVIQGNLMGTDASGLVSLANRDGIRIEADSPPANPATGNVIGGDGPGEGNVIEGLATVTLEGEGVSRTVVAGNIIGLAADGATDLVPAGGGIFIHASDDNLVGGPSVGSRNIISGNATGVHIFSGVAGQADDNVVQGNYIGTDITGLLDRGNSGGGILIACSQCTGTLIEDNVVSGNVLGIGVGNSSLVRGNFIGVAADGSPLPNDSDGISLSGADNMVGGSGGDANVIAYNGENGVKLFPDATGTRITRNSIHDNGLLGIKLEAGANNDQPAPVLSGAEVGFKTSVSGTLAGAPNQNYQLEFFSNDNCDTSGFGEGHTFIGFATLTADASGDVVVDVVTLDATTPGDVVTATATDEEGNTSEFSNCVIVVEAPPTPTPTASPTPTATPTGTPGTDLIQGDVTCDGIVDEDDFTFMIQYFAGLNDGTQPGPCPDLGQALPASVAFLWGDVDCVNGLNVLDALYVLAHTVAIELERPQGCVAIGSPIT